LPSAVFSSAAAANLIASLFSAAGFSVSSMFDSTGVSVVSVGVPAGFSTSSIGESSFWPTFSTIPSVSLSSVGAETASSSIAFLSPDLSVVCSSVGFSFFSTADSNGFSFVSVADSAGFSTSSVRKSSFLPLADSLVSSTGVSSGPGCSAVAMSPPGL